MLDKCTVKAPAKINLSLDVIGKRPDGYHLLETIMQTVGLYDIIGIEVFRAEQPVLFPEIVILCTDDEVPTDVRNTSHRAASAYFKKLASTGTGQRYSVSRIEITIQKGIPLEAGLAGGSADAAGTLAGLNHLFGAALPWEEMQRIAAATGADVPFCLIGGTVLCRGIGEILEPAADFSSRPAVLVKPDFGVSTPWAFRQFDAAGRFSGPDTPAILAALSRGDAAGVFGKTANVLENVVFLAHPVLGEIRSGLKQMRGCIGSLMSGSGATIFAVFDQPADARDAADIMHSRYDSRNFMIMEVQTVGTGPEIIDG